MQRVDNHLQVQHYDRRSTGEQVHLVRAAVKRPPAQGQSLYCRHPPSLMPELMARLAPHPHQEQRPSCVAQVGARAAATSTSAQSHRGMPRGGQCQSRAPRWHAQHPEGGCRARACPARRMHQLCRPATTSAAGLAGARDARGRGCQHPKAATGRQTRLRHRPALPQQRRMDPSHWARLVGDLATRVGATTASAPRYH